MKRDEQEYIPEGEDYVPVGRWGVDHWATLAYLETRAVDHKGIIRNAHMRTHVRLHRHFVGIESGLMQDGAKYPTRLNDETMIPDHDDWSCLEDMIVAGLMRSWFWVARHGAALGDCDARIEFTDEGLRLSAELRAHKARGGSVKDFAPSLVRA